MNLTGARPFAAAGAVQVRCLRFGYGGVCAESGKTRTTETVKFELTRTRVNSGEVARTRVNFLTMETRGTVAKSL